MEIKEIKTKEIWENFLLGCEEKTFLQSWNWGEFQEKMGNKIWRLGIYENQELVSAVLVAKIPARRGTFLLIQHGPTIAQNSPKQNKFATGQAKLKTQILKTLLEELKKIAKKEKANFIRMNPLWERTEENKNLFYNLGFKQAPMHANAYEATWKLNLNSSEQELLAQMRKTTRYLIRQGLKNSELSIIKSQNPNDIEVHDKLNKEVAKFQKFVPFSFQYAKNELETLLKDAQASLFFGKYQDKIISSALIVFWSNIAFYHQAALSPKYHNLPMAYLSQWEAIKEAKKRGCNLYDFWGYVNPKENPKHPWAGSTLFKMGFGGRAYEYIKTQDFPISKKYWLIYLFEKARKIKRRL